MNFLCFFRDELRQDLVTCQILVLRMEYSLDEAVSERLVDVHVDEDVAKGTGHLAGRNHDVGLPTGKTDSSRVLSFSLDRREVHELLSVERLEVHVPEVHFEDSETSVVESLCEGILVVLQSVSLPDGKPATSLGHRHHHLSVSDWADHELWILRVLTLGIIGVCSWKTR